MSTENQTGDPAGNQGGDLGLTGAVSMALGGMIGGGIYAVLGVVVNISGQLAWLSFVLAGLVALCAGYSYIKLNQLSDPEGASPTYLEWFADSSTLAGMAGWTLLFGYVGSMAMYAYAFGSYFVDIISIDQLFGLPMRPLLSLAIIGIFVALNLVGVEESGWVEIVLVVVKIAVLVGFVGFGLWFGSGNGGIQTGLGSIEGITFEPIMAAAMSFVAFQGWQLLMYSQATIKDHSDTNPTAIYISIPTAVLIYIGVAIVTTSIVGVSLVSQHPEVALATAASQFGGSWGHLIISLSALFSTASAINATLFTSAQFSDRLIENDLLPTRLDTETPDEFEEGALPKRIILLLGVLTAAFTVVGSLEGITSFASLTFIVVFGGMSYLALTQRDHEDVSAIPPAIGLVGTVVFLPLMMINLFNTQRTVFYTVVAISLVVTLVELAYFRTDILEERTERDVSRSD
ncbi:APC family permease [Halogeometricum sp. S1BR25-6]|uniref:APC family permease n=1 Tax=Halogeometricum salsisoli TaxID=2950536 RepID=A0ABU2GBL7_9EURY|nr:APC family permease [Halogeometricum sp. S1BR25-6]MDS0298177.1 APC family permease [Halogeometricum sp. S1BR25-6]